MKFRLRAGQHIDENGRYAKGDIVESDVDLVEKLGREKFELVSSRSRPVQGARPGNDQGDDEDGDDGTPTPPAQQQPQPVKAQADQAKIDTDKYPSLRGQKAPANEQEFNAMLDRLSVQELRTLAGEMGVDVGNSSRKEDIIRRIKASR